MKTGSRQPQSQFSVDETGVKLKSDFKSFQQFSKQHNANIFTRFQILFSNLTKAAHCFRSDFAFPSWSFMWFFNEVNLKILLTGEKSIIIVYIRNDEA